MRNKFIFLLILLVVSVVAVLVVQRARARAAEEQKKLTQAAVQTVPVSVDYAVREAVPLDVRTFGTVEASAAVTIMPQMAGKVAAVHFTEGQSVGKDALLFLSLIHI